jgi:hypothetical protein
MGLFNETDCDGKHAWGEVERRELWGNVSYSTRCGRGDCNVTSWGDSPAEAMANAQDFDRDQRARRI